MLVRFRNVTAGVLPEGSGLNVLVHPSKLPKCSRNRGFDGVEKEIKNGACAPIPLLLFDSNCAEAMTLCHECLGGEADALTNSAIHQMKEQFPPEKHQRIINARLESGEIANIGVTDWMASPAYEPVHGDTFADPRHREHSR